MNQLLRTILIFWLIQVQIPTEAQKPDRFRLMFYNVENLFDTEDDPKTSDDEFTPQGARRWNEWRLNKKLGNIYKVIAAIGEASPPDIIGFCEIENRYVLELLLQKTPLKNAGYEIIHRDSRDPRGIDVAMLYRKDRYWPLEEKFILVEFKSSPGRFSRDILYSKGLLPNKDTLHVFINHWPSKFGGAMTTRPMRNEVAQALRNTIDSILAKNPKANIILTGDFNTTPEDEPVEKVLRACMFPDTARCDLINLTTAIYPSKYPGTIKFQGLWECIDMWIISSNLINNTKGNTKTSTNNVFIGNFNFLLEPDETYGGKKLFRTYVGFSYRGGFADHLPTFMDLILTHPQQSGEKQ